MASNYDDEEMLRYIAYLQRGMMTPGMDEVFDQERLKAWWFANGSQRPAGYSDEIWKEQTTVLLAFHPMTPHEEFFSQGIFRGIIDDVHATARAIGVEVRRPIVFATSTDVAPTPAARPTDGSHMIFAGPGLSMFCNYWGKVIARIATTLARLDPAAVTPPTRSDIERAAMHDPMVVLLAIKLALYFAGNNTVVGFGMVEDVHAERGFRVELVRAMELFAVGHEYGHCVVEERHRSLSSSQDSAAMHRVEFTCDAIGGAISMHWGSTAPNWSAFTCSGGLVFLWATELCVSVQQLLSPDSRGEPKSSSHPEVRERIRRLAADVLRRTPADQLEMVQTYLQDLEGICTTLAGIVLEVVGTASRS